MEAMQVTRQMVIAATQLGLLNGFFRNDGSNGVTQLFRVFMADINLRPLATRVLELLTFEDALQVLNFSLAEWADSYKKNFEKLTS
jgi:hypothetical protein